MCSTAYMYIYIYIYICSDACVVEKHFRSHVTSIALYSISVNTIAIDITSVIIFLDSIRWRLWPVMSGFIHSHEDVIRWKHFPCYWPFVRGFHRSPVNSPLKGQWCGPFSIIIFIIIIIIIIIIINSIIIIIIIIIHLRLNKQLSKPLRRRWFGTPSYSLWRHCNDSSTHLVDSGVFVVICQHLNCFEICF